MSIFDAQRPPFLRSFETVSYSRSRAAFVDFNDAAAARALFMKYGAIREAPGWYGSSRRKIHHCKRRKYALRWPRVRAVCAAGEFAPPASTFTAARTEYASAELPLQRRRDTHEARKARRARRAPPERYGGAPRLRCFHHTPPPLPRHASFLTDVADCRYCRKKKIKRRGTMSNVQPAIR